MCLITFHYVPNQSLVLAANRDEYFARPAAPLSIWQEGIAAGKDLKEGGTWLGVNAQRRLVALTNVRVLGVAPQNPPSRGQLVKDILLSDEPLEQTLSHLLERAKDYAPFNLIAGDVHQLWYLSNYPEPVLQSIPAGTHALSNAQLNTPWPKVELAKQQLNSWLQESNDLTKLECLLSSQQIFADELLPSTGVPLELERMLSAQFIRTPSYGTRCSTAVALNEDRAYIAETTWDEKGQAVGSASFEL